MDLRSGNRGNGVGSEDARARATINQQSQPQDPTPQRDRRSCGGPGPRGERRGTGSGRVEERGKNVRNSRKVVAAMWKMGETRAEVEKNIDNRVLVQ